MNHVLIAVFQRFHTRDQSVRRSETIVPFRCHLEWKGE